MKRYKILIHDFDTRAFSLNPAPEQWSSEAKVQHRINQENTIAGLLSQFGQCNLGQKIENFKELGSKPFSVAAFHNRFLEQIRNSYVIGSYYAALTGACALGERILNHMILILRDYHKDTPEYKKIFRKKSIDYWPTAIDALDSWGELLPEVAPKFRELYDKRNHAIHFNPDVDSNDKKFAIEAIHLIQEIISLEFSSFGTQPWYFCVPGEIYIKKEWENKPLIRNIFIKSAALVGPKHKVLSLAPKIVVNDDFEYENKDISDEEYKRLRQMELGQI